jgi:hypothetical protein
MAEMKVRVTPTGHAQFGAWREGTLDDLVFCGGAGVLGRLI